MADVQLMELEGPFPRPLVAAPKLAGWRLRLFALWIAQFAHFAGVYGLRVFVVLRLGSSGQVSSASAWHLVTAVFLIPSIFLVPVYGAIGNSLPKSSVLRWTAFYLLLVAAAFTWLNAGWLWCVVLVALGSASFAPTRLALLPAAAEQCQLPLNRVVGAIETGSVLAIVAGMTVGGAFADATLPAISTVASNAMSAAMLWVTGCCLVCLLAIMPVWFPNDIWRPASVGAALRGFARDGVQLLSHAQAGGPLLAVAFVRGVVTAGAGAFIAVSLYNAAENPHAPDPIKILMTIALISMAGTALGSFAASLFGSLKRSLGLVPIGALGITLGMIGVAVKDTVPLSLCFVVGCFGGLVNVPLLSAFQKSVPAETRGNAMALLNTAGYLGMTLSSLFMAGLVSSGLVTPHGQFWVVATLSAAGLLTAFWCLWPAVGRLFGVPSEGCVTDDAECVNGTRAASACPTKSPE